MLPLQPAGQGQVDLAGSTLADATWYPPLLSSVDLAGTAKAVAAWVGRTGVSRHSLGRWNQPGLYHLVSSERR